MTSESPTVCAGIVQTGTLTDFRTLPQADRAAARLPERMGAAAYDAAFARGCGLTDLQIAPSCSPRSTPCWQRSRRRRGQAVRYLTGPRCAVPGRDQAAAMVDGVPGDSLEEAAGRFARAERVVVLTGAGISTESRIPDFDPQGLWTRDPAAERRATIVLA